MKAVNLFSRIFCSGATMKARVKFDELVAKYSNMPVEDIEKSIKELVDKHNELWPKSRTLLVDLERCSFSNEPSYRDEDGHLYLTDNHTIIVSGPWHKTKKKSKCHYLAVDWRITGEPAKVKEIVYKTETV